MNMKKQLASVILSSLAALALAGWSACSQRSVQDGRDNQSAAFKGGSNQPAALPANAALREQLVMAMSGYEHTVSKTELQAMGTPDAIVAALIGIYGDNTVHPAVRVQALTSLRFFPGPQSKAALESALAAPETPDVVRRPALKAYGVGFGDDAVDLVSKFLDHKDLHTRNAAARSLSDLGTQRALAVLRLRLPEEQNQMVKSTIEAGLRHPK
jgi:hypothetical protein